MRAIFFCLFLISLGCGPLQKPDSDPDVPDGPSDPIALRLEFEEVLKHAQAKETGPLLETLERYLLTREHLREIFGPVIGERVWAGYGDTIAAKLRAEAAQVIIARVAEGATKIEVRQVGPAYPKHTTLGDQKMLDAMVKKLPMYSVRIHKPGEPLGLRLNGFIFYRGRWRALLKSYDFIDPPATDAATP